MHPGRTAPAASVQHSVEGLRKTRRIGWERVRCDAGLRSHAAALRSEKTVDGRGIGLPLPTRHRSEERRRQSRPRTATNTPAPRGIQALAPGAKTGVSGNGPSTGPEADAHPPGVCLDPLRPRNGTSIAQRGALRRDPPRLETTDASRRAKAGFLHRSGSVSGRHRGIPPVHPADDGPRKAARACVRGADCIRAGNACPRDDLPACVVPIAAADLLLHQWTGTRANQGAPGPLLQDLSVPETSTVEPRVFYVLASGDRR
mmetsp:Transcript_4511/g.28686  ORF Transcript_4511/g.28686 Transcript_4511/m.28686 type:complete len:259 (+) Transcript_4511:731-1507(+)